MWDAYISKFKPNVGFGNMCLGLRGDTWAIEDKYSIIDSSALLDAIMLCKIGTQKWSYSASGISSLAFRKFNEWMVAECGLEWVKE